MFNFKDRGCDDICLLCANVTTKHTTLTSLFLSQRAWGGQCEWSDTNRCSNCGFIFHGRGLCDQEVNDYYQNYRNEEYFLYRNQCEPFYTKKIHDNLTYQMDSEERKLALLNYLQKYHISLFHEKDNISVLDYGGGKGGYIAKLPGKKFIFDISGEVPIPGVFQLSSEDIDKMRFDLIVCAQVLEHVTDPKSFATHLYSLVKPGGCLYIEVPYNETWRDFSCSGRIRNLILSCAKKFNWFNVALDTYGTVFRVKFKFLPPFGFVPVREHLNYFYPNSLITLGKSMGGTVIDASRVPLLGTTLLLKKI